MSMKRFEVDVPGKFRADVAFLDLETFKVPCEWVSPAGEKLSRRWSAFMAGVTSFRRITILDDGLRMLSDEPGEEDEPAFLAEIAKEVGGRTVCYRATRKFDEMILKGRYTYARRGPAPEPFYPAMPGAEDLSWFCGSRERYDFWDAKRERELESKFVPDTYAWDSARVVVHNLRDMATLIVAYGEPDRECQRWLRRILTDLDFAYAAVFGPEWGSTMGFVAP